MTVTPPLQLLLRSTTVNGKVMSKLKIRGFEEHVNIPVLVELLDDETVEFVMKFKRSDKKQLEKIVKETQDRAITARDLENKKIISDDEEREKLDKEINKLNKQYNETLVSRIVSWSEFYDIDDKEVEFSVKVLKELLDHPAFFKAIDAAFWLATGERIKN